MSDKPHIERIPVEAQVYREVRDRILSGTLKPGRRLIQEDLATEFGVSRIPVRDALKRLESEGMIVTGPRGAAVPDVSRDAIEDIYLLRERVEGLAARRCAERAPEAAASVMSRLLDRMAANARAGQHVDNLRLDYAFHAEIYFHAGSTAFARVSQLLWSGFAPNAASWITGRTLSAKDRASLKLSQDEHRAIVQAIAAGDADAAEAAAVVHIRNARAAILAREARQ